MTIEALPRLRRNLRYVRQVQDGKVAYVVKDPLSLKYFRFGEVEAWLMQQMDGTRSLAQVAEELRAYCGISTTGAALETFFRRLKELGLAERTQAERSLLLLEKLREQRRARIEGHGNTLLRMRFSLGDPDELFNRTIGRIRFFWTPGFVIASMVAFLAYGVIVAVRWDEFMQGTMAMYDPTQYTLGFIVALYAIFLVTGGIHELGHGYTCKHFGGEVHEIGAMLLYFSPALFCNVNDAWTFEKKGHRLWVTFAGGWIQLWIAAVAAVAWILVEPGTWVERAAFLTMLLSGGLSILVNFNPLIPLDGYYALMDWLEIPNLRARSFAFTGAYLKRNLLRSDADIPPATPRETRIFLIYGILAFLYTSFILLAVATWAGSLVVAKFGAWGWVMVAAAGWMFARKPLRRSARAVRVWAAAQVAQPRVRRSIAAGAGGVVFLVMLAVLVPWTVRVQGRAVVEPAQRSWLRPESEGWIDTILVSEGTRVQTGDIVAILRNPELELEWAHARATVDALEHESAEARALGYSAQARHLEIQLASHRAHFADLDRRRSGLVLRAPYAAQVVTPRLDELVGARAAAGDSLIELWSTGPLRARVVVAQRDAGEIAAGAQVGIKFPVRPDWTWRTQVQHVSPAAQNGRIEALAQLGTDQDGAQNAENPLRPGMVGRAKVIVGETSIAGALTRALRRTVRLDWLL